jgi:hypothetical protein
MKARKPLTLQQIRIERHKLRGNEASDKNLASYFSTVGADDEELAYLAIFRAVYRRAKDLDETAAPIEYLIKDLLFSLSYWPLSFEWLRESFAECEQACLDREKIARVLNDELEEARGLRRRFNIPRSGKVA